jgi:hypothetical protein
MALLCYTERRSPHAVDRSRGRGAFRCQALAPRLRLLPIAVQLPPQQIARLYGKAKMAIKAEGENTPTKNVAANQHLECAAARSG